MKVYFFKRFLASIGVLLAIMSLSFFLMRVAPGGPFDQDKRLSPVVEANLWKTYGMADEVRASTTGTVARIVVSRGQEVYEGESLVRLLDGSALLAPRDGTVLTLSVKEGAAVVSGQPIGAFETPLWSQYVTAMSNYIVLDFGVSMKNPERTVQDLIAQTFPVSMELGLWSLLIALLFGVSIGLFAGTRANTWADYVPMSLAMIGVSLSAIVLGPLLILLFGVHLGWFDIGGWEGWRSKVLPSMTLGLIYAATFARLTRGGMLEVIRQDYIRTARAKGLGEWSVVFRHALRPAILPTVTYLGPAVAGLLCGSVVVERIFNIPGVSEFFVSGALNRDYSLVMGVVVLFSSLLVVLNFVVDVAYTWLDPRVKMDG